MTAAMSQAELNDFEVEGVHIKVPRASRDKYIGAIAAANALPTHAKDFMRKALDSSSAWESREQKQQRMKLAVEQELSHIIGWFPYVQQASVIYDLQSVKGPRRVEKASATVSVLPKPGETINSRRTRTIQKLVAGGFANMTPEQVTVNNMGGEDAFGSSGDAQDPESYETPYHRERVRVENDVRRSILNRLRDIPGVRVQVNAILDATISTTTNRVEPETQVARAETTDNEKITDRVTDNAQRPGLTTNGPRGVRGDDSPSRLTEREVTNDRSTNEYVVGSATTQTIEAGMAAKEIQASIGVPREYVLAVWRQKQRLLTGEVPTEIDQTTMSRAEDEVKSTIVNAVQPLLPKLVRESDYEQVKVGIIDTLESEPLPEPSIASNALAWAAGNSSMLVMVGVALFSVVMLRSVVSGSSDADADAAGSPILQLDSDGQPVPAGAAAGGGDEEDEEGRPKLKLRKAESLKDDLSEIVRSDPDAAAAILRGWIGNAG